MTKVNKFKGLVGLVITILVLAMTMNVAMAFKVNVSGYAIDDAGILDEDTLEILKQSLILLDTNYDKSGIVWIKGSQGEPTEQEVQEMYLSGDYETDAIILTVFRYDGENKYSCKIWPVNGVKLDYGVNWDQQYYNDKIDQAIWDGDYKNGLFNYVLACNKLFLNDLNANTIGSFLSGQTGDSSWEKVETKEEQQRKLERLLSRDRVIDTVGVLKDSDIEKLNKELSKLREKYDRDMVIAIVDTYYGLDIEGYALEYYNRSYYYDGAIMFIAMDDSEMALVVTDDLLRLSGYGINDSKLNSILDNVEKQLVKKKYAKACDAAVDGFKSMLKLTEKGGKIADSVHSNGIADFPWFPSILFSIAWGFGAMVIVLLILVFQLKSVKKQSNAASYQVRGSFKLTGQRDMFVRSSVTTRRIESSSSGGRSGGGRSGGVRTSSGGARGASRKF